MTTTTNPLAPTAVGTEAEVTGTVTYSETTKGQHKPRRLIILAGEHGETVKTFVSLDSDLGTAVVGEEWTISGIVKGYEQRGRVLQTVLTRARGWEPDAFFDMPSPASDALDLARGEEEL